MNTNRTTASAVRTALLTSVLFTACPGTAAMVTFTDRTTFLVSASAGTATGALPNSGFVGQGPATVGDVVLNGFPNNLLHIGGASVSPSFDWTTRLPGHDIAIDGTELLGVSFPSVFSLGFDIVEPEMDLNLNAPFIDSIFRVDLFNGATPVGTYQFNPPNDTAAFSGVWSDMPFTRAEIREIVCGSENEFFGQFYTGVTPVPEPSPILLGLLMSAGSLLRRRR